MSFTPSKYQLAIFDWFANNRGASKHLIVEAVAGSGKTSTIVELFRRIPLNVSAIFVAFNKHIAENLQAKGLPARTLHSLGMEVCRNNTRGRLQVKADKVANIIKFDMFDIGKADKKDKAKCFKCLGPILKIISLAKGNALTTLDEEWVDEMIEHHGIELPDYKDFGSLLQDAWQRQARATSSIDFDDMLYLPIVEGWEFPAFDVACVDETQDLNKVQYLMVKELVRKGGTAIFVGDSHQAIYGFRGADPESMANIKAAMKCDELPLSICYRCAKTVVERAKDYVPHIEAAENAEAGKVEEISEETFDSEISEGDYVLCRTTAPLVSKCMKLISQGRLAKVIGKDIASGLLAMVQDIAKGQQQPIEEFLTLLRDFQSQEKEKLERVGKEAQADILDDKCECIRVLAMSGKVVADIERRISEVFSEYETREGITLSTVHKAKGLEAERVFILRPDLLPHPRAEKDWQVAQERNLCYVAITRAMKELYWVRGKDNE